MIGWAAAAWAGSSQEADWVFQGREWGDSCGASIGLLDSNGDGFDDLVTVTSSRGGETGVFYGSPAGLSNQPDVRLDSWRSYGFAAGGDFDGDGFDNLVTSRPAGLFGHPGSADGPSSVHGWTIETAFPPRPIGDADRDGTDDLALFGFGFLEVRLGGPDGLSADPSLSLTEALAADASCGLAVHGLDADGDGYVDLAVGCPNRSEVLVFRGGPTGFPLEPAWTVHLDGVLTIPGDSGDFDGDGYDDLVVHAYNSMTGGVWVFAGGVSGPAPIPDWNVTGAPYDGLRAALTGDLDGDGDDDLLVATPYHADPERNEGLLQLYEGGGAGLATEPTWSYEPNLQNAYLGGSVALGDLNGDGADDLVVGIPAWGEMAGAVLAFHGPLHDADSEDEAGDADGDGVPAGEDCNDTDGEIGLPSDRWADQDGDGVGGGAPVETCIPRPQGWVEVGGDCDDADPERTQDCEGRCGCTSTAPSGWLGLAVIASCRWRRRGLGWTPAGKDSARSGTLAKFVDREA